MDDAQFAEVWDRHSGEALRLAVLLCGDRQRAEDAVSEAFARMYARRGATRIDNPGAYLRRAVVNEVRNGWRRRFYERREAARHHGDDRGALAHDDALGVRDEVQRLLAQLPERQRTALVLRFHADLTEAQTAEVMGCPVGTVKSLTSRALTRLRGLQAAELTNGGAR
jgi:RNA polymerase sigma-70 factor (sigma-E family)